jgi:mono/diheme cytochrome c family protein
MKFNLKTGIFISAAIAGLYLSGCYYDHEDKLYRAVNNAACDTTAITYGTSITAIMNTNCNSCHGGSAPQGGIKLDSYAGVKATVDNARLLGSIQQAAGYSPMPKGGGKLSDCDIKKVSLWIAAGAPNN